VTGLAVIWLSGCWVQYTLPAETDGAQGSTSVVECGPPDDPSRICGGVCVDVGHDSENCGGCGIACEEDETCEDGVCEEAPPCDCHPELEVCEDDVCLCRPGLERCGEDCVQLRNDPEHCGECGNDCGDAFCIEDSCEDDCFAPLPDVCDSGCTDVELDPLNCGDCGERCGVDELCIFGSCRFFAALEDECDECPCDEICEAYGDDLTCCWSPLIEEPVCLDTPLCAD